MWFVNDLRSFRSSMPKIKKNLWQSRFFEVITFFNMIAIVLMIDVYCLRQHNLLSHYLHVEYFLSAFERTGGRSVNM